MRPKGAPCKGIRWKTWAVPAAVIPICAPENGAGTGTKVTDRLGWEDVRLRGKARIPATSAAKHSAWAGKTNEEPPGIGVATHHDRPKGNIQHLRAGYGTTRSPPVRGITCSILQRARNFLSLILFYHVSRNRAAESVRSALFFAPGKPSKTPFPNFSATPWPQKGGETGLFLFRRKLNAKTYAHFGNYLSIIR